ncbi:DUF3907 family protein [Thalassobacillus pellis]|uniref:DUF3907 family protein n=1 Tax=Thalassobacillus pellis TaxID=748008 RepID=UPI00196021C1|nr:DUF3907 family protein [Thalassobacillus pellis]MBM7552413.1 hypothetical protein [Thalassobacillus pellis]
MSERFIRTQLHEVGDFLEFAVTQLSDYLDYYPLNSLLEEEGSRDREYYRDLLHSLRRLEVFCKEAHDTISGLAKLEAFRKASVERTLYGIYHQCIAEFFSPKSDTWMENSRAAYTGESSIQFQQEPPRSMRVLFSKLERPFQDIRMNLEFYESDYLTQQNIRSDKEGPAS